MTFDELESMMKLMLSPLDPETLKLKLGALPEQEQAGLITALNQGTEEERKHARELAFSLLYGPTAKENSDGTKCEDPASKGVGNS